MTAMTLADLGWAGITATVAYGKLRLSAPPGVLTAAMQERIAASRDDLLRELAQDAQRAHLLAVAPDELLPADLVHGLRDADVVACDGEPDDALRAYLHAVGARERMARGFAPLEWGEPVARTCEGCGPVLLWAECPPLVKACPWCIWRKAGQIISRPLVACADCLHYRPNAMNPVGGGGDCERGHAGCWPRAMRRCADKAAERADSLLISDSVGGAP